MFNGGNILGIVVVGLLSGVAVCALLYGLFSLFVSTEARVKARVKQFVINEGRPVFAEDESRERQRETLFAELDSRWEDQSLFKSLSKSIEAADLRITPTELLFLQLIVGMALGLLLLAVVPIIGILLLPVGIYMGISLVRSYVGYLGKRRITRFEEQLPDNLAILAGSVRGGFSLYQALQLISREAGEPSKTEFNRIVQEISLGNPMSTALEGMSKRIPTEDVDILVTAIIMQQQTGGNLTHVLDVVASTIRDRHRVEREIKSLTAQQRFSAIILAAAPVILGAILYYISPQYMSALFQPGWVLCMPVGAMVMSVIGFLVMRKLADIDV